MPSLPSNTGLFYHKMMNGVAVNVHQTAAAPLHHCNELRGLVFPPCVTGRPTVCCATSWMTRRRAFCRSSRTQRPPPCSVTSRLVLEDREGTEHKIILYPTGQQHAAAVSELISNYPQMLWVSCKGKELSRGRHFTVPVSLWLISGCPELKTHYIWAEKVIWFESAEVSSAWQGGKTHRANMSAV